MNGISAAMYSCQWEEAIETWLGEVRICIIPIQEVKFKHFIIRNSLYLNRILVTFETEIFFK